MKACKTCGVLKDLSSFYADRGQLDGRRKDCKVCKNLLVKEWRSENKSKWNAYMRKHRAEHPLSIESRKRNSARSRKSRYGITQEQYEEILELQNYSCAICGKHQDGFTRRLHVDHSHKSRKIRGLLCRNCNYYLGYIAEDQSIIATMCAYIKKHS